MRENVCSGLSFSDFLEQYFNIVFNPKTDGHIHRFSTTGRRGDLDGWYVYYENPGKRDVCVANSWRYATDNLIWVSGEGAITSDLHSYIKQKMEESERLDREEKARVAIEAVREYSNMTPADDSHPYLKAKGVHAYEGVAVTDHGATLIIPVYTPEGEIVSYQKIFKDPSDVGRFRKIFKKGGRTSGCFFVIGNPSSGESAWLCEGYATGASIYEATGLPVVVAFFGNNMKAVAEALNGRLKLTVVADNDDKGKGTNPGKAYAETTGLPYKMIPEAGMDANDYATAHGLAALKDFLCPSSSEWIEKGDDFIRKPSPMKWLIKGWLPEEGLVMVYGASNSGKTFAVLDMLLSMSTGRQKWQGRKAKKASCLYLCGEGKAGLRGRVAVWVQEHNGISTGRFGVSSGPKQLNESADLSYVAEQIRLSRLNPKVIAIDTLNRFFSGNENKADEIGGFLGALSELQAETHALIILIHHTGVSEEAQNRARGSSAIRGAVDIEIHVENENGCITLTQTKQRDAEIQDPIHLRLVSREIEGWFDEDGEPVKSAVLESLKEEEKRTIEATAEISVLMSAWLHSGHGLALGYPSITVDELRAYMRNGLGWSKDKVKKAFASDGNSRFLRKLYLSGMVQAMDDLIVLTDSVYATCCFLSLKGMEKDVVPSGANMVPSKSWHQ